MAFYGRRYKRKTYRRRRSKYTKTERAAYEYGRVSVGRKNPNSKVSLAFSKGVQSANSYNARIANPNPRSMF